MEIWIDDCMKGAMLVPLTFSTERKVGLPIKRKTRVFIDKRFIEILGAPCCLLFAIVYYLSLDLKSDEFVIEYLLEKACVEKLALTKKE
jgi:hypothetical protein